MREVFRRDCRARYAPVNAERNSSKRCVVAYATRDRQYLWAVDVPLEATIAETIEAARQLADEPDVPWEAASVGIYGQLRDRNDRPVDGDRVEIYRPLPSDPRETRRQRVQQARKNGGR